MSRLSWLGRLNCYILQWFFVRLARVVDQRGTQVGWRFMWGIVPLSGYGSRPFQVLKWGRL